MGETRMSMAEKMADGTCQTCKYRVGRQCRRYPPFGGFFLWLVSDGFPWVEDREWCGEYLASSSGREGGQ
jgi:hypothetical protein